jgi:hypothetical protein
MNHAIAEFLERPAVGLASAASLLGASSVAQKVAESAPTASAVTTWFTCLTAGMIFAFWARKIILQFLRDLFYVIKFRRLPPDINNGDDKDPQPPTQ